jgi:hypothetical protein
MTVREYTEAKRELSITYRAQIEKAMKSALSAVS